MSNQPKFTVRKFSLLLNVALLSSLNLNCSETKSDPKVKMPTPQEIKEWQKDPHDLQGLKKKLMFQELPALTNLAAALGYVYPWGCKDGLANLEKGGNNSLADLENKGHISLLEHDQGNITILNKQSGCEYADLQTQYEFHSWNVVVLDILDEDSIELNSSVGNEANENQDADEQMYKVSIKNSLANALSADQTLSQVTCNTESLTVSEEQFSKAKWSISTTVNAGFEGFGSTSITTSVGEEQGQSSGKDNMTEKKICTEATVATSHAIDSGDSAFVLMKTKTKKSRSIRDIKVYVTFGVKIKGQLRISQESGNKHRDYQEGYNKHEWIQTSWGGEGEHYTQAMVSDIKNGDGPWLWKQIYDSEYFDAFQELSHGPIKGDEKPEVLQGKLQAEYYEKETELDLIVCSSTSTENEDENCTSSRDKPLSAPDWNDI